jgi:HlyD family secretion protein
LHWRVIALASLPAFALLYWLAARNAPQATLPVSVRTVKVHRGPLEVSRRVAGTIAAGRFATIAAPILTSGERSQSGLELIFLVEGGTLVKKGELIARIDAEEVQNHVDDVTAQVAQLDLELLRRRTGHKAEVEALEQQVRVAKANYEKALLDERTAEIRPEFTRDFLRMAVLEMQAIYEQVSTEVPLTAERQLRDLNVYQLTRNRQARHRDRHITDLRHYEIKAPMDGLVVLMTLTRNGEARQMRVGEQLTPGQPILRVVDPGSMLLDGTVNQAEIELFRLGQQASIHFDAYPDLNVRGRVRSVGAMALTSRRASNYIRRIPLRISLDEQAQQVIPDLSASADVLVGEEESTLQVPRQAIGSSGGKAVVYVKQADGEFVPREVQLGATSPTHAAILAGVSDGDEIAAQAMEDD